MGLKTARELLAVLEEHKPTDWSTARTRCQLGAILCSQARQSQPTDPSRAEPLFAEAEKLLLTGHQTLSDDITVAPELLASHLNDAEQTLISLYEAWARPQAADVWRQRAKLNNIDRKP